jgi:hypothetical protein
MPQLSQYSDTVSKKYRLDALLKLFDLSSNGAEYLLPNVCR